MQNPDHHPAAQSHRRWLILASASMAILAITLATVLFWPTVPLAAEEEALVGLWYMELSEPDGESFNIAVVSQRRDRVLDFASRRFARTGEATKAKWYQVPEGGRDRVHGRWELNGDMLQWTLIDTPDDKSLWKRLVTLVREFRWERNEPEVVEARVTRTDVNHLGLELQMFDRPKVNLVRVPDDFELPDEPVPAAEVLAWWERRKHGER